MPCCNRRKAVPEEVVILSLPLTITQHRPGIIRIITGTFRGTRRALIIARLRVSPRKRRIATGRTLSLVPVTRSLVRPLLTQEPTLRGVRGSRLMRDSRLIRGSRRIGGPHWRLKALLTKAGSWRGPVETGIEAAITFGMVTVAIGITTPG